MFAASIHSTLAIEHYNSGENFEDNVGENISLLTPTGLIDDERYTVYVIRCNNI